MHVNNVIYFKFKICVWNFSTCNCNVGNYLQTYFIHILTGMVIIYLGSNCLSFGYCLFFNTPDCVLNKYWALISKNNQSMDIYSFMSIEYYCIHLSLKRDHRLSLSWIWILRGLFRNYCDNTNISLSHWQVCVELGINTEET